MSSASLPVVLQMLANLDHFLEKAREHVEAKGAGVAEADLVNTALAPDMYPLGWQVNLACKAAARGIANLAGVPESKVAGDPSGTLEELRQTVAKTIAVLNAVPASAIDARSAEIIAWEVRNKIRRMPAEAYLKHWFLPNFSFHVTIAYAILRSKGVALGKFDYLMGTQADDGDAFVPVVLKSAAS